MKYSKYLYNRNIDTDDFSEGKYIHLPVLSWLHYQPTPILPFYIAFEGNKCWGETIMDYNQVKTK